MNRKVYPVIPPKTEYSLTEFGRTLEPVLNSLCSWGQYYISTQSDQNTETCEGRRSFGSIKMIKIISDSTCDLSQEVLEKYDIDIIPLHIVKGNEELEDGPAIDISALYKWADENKTTPKTSAPSIETAMNIMRPYIEAGREIICFSISGEMSTSGNVIRMAAEELEAEDAVTVIDSRNLSTGIGLLVVEAAIMAADGVLIPR